MNILITGAAGFIGSHLADRLLADGHTVTGCDNLETGRLDNATSSDFYELNIVDRRGLYDLANMARPNLIIHCAASYSDPWKWHRDIDTNVSGTVNVVNAARHHNARIVYFQTSLPPVSSYAISKIAAERYIHIGGVSALVFRLANIYGPRNLSGPIPTFFKRLTAGEPCTVADTARDMIYIDNLVQCVQTAVTDGLSGIFDVCSGTETRIIDLYWAVASHFPNAPDPEIIAADDSDVKTVLSAHDCVPGFVAWYPLEHGVTRAVDWYREHGVGQTFTHLQSFQRA